MDTGRAELTCFVRRVAMFALVAAVLLAAGEWMVRRYVPNPYRAKHEMMMAGALPRTVIVGNSHSYYGVDPSMLPGGRAVSLANVSQTLDYDLALLQHYERLGRLDSVRTLIGQVSYTSLFDMPFEDSPEWWRCNNYKIYMGLERHGALSRYAYELARPSTYFAKLKTLAGMGSAGLRCDSLGFGLGYEADAEDRPEDWTGNGAAIAGYHNEWADTANVAANVGVLDGMLALARRHGARLVLFTQPEWRSYREAVDSGKLAVAWRALREFDDRNDDVVWVNYYDDADFPAEDFHDADHLNARGAERLTRRLVQDAGLGAGH